MFTGIITDIGTVLKITKAGDTRFDIACKDAPETIDIGASICCAGACMTVVEKGAGAQNWPENWFAVEVSAESLSKTTLGNWQVGSKLNLERSLKAGDEMGGHVVSGHVDGVGKIIAIEGEGDSQRFTFEVPDDLARFIAPKGSVTLNGTSLTVNEVDGNRFGVNIIRHTQEVTTWGNAFVREAINIEIDMLARYVARLAEFPARLPKVEAGFGTKTRDQKD
ncbi:Riboflavin synthase eubacterial/eukaryotic [hydrothermal vent metagenome]|uniref:Riboflavin synthase n=1 Tax=hydrothermal vent metagenome TaxID=652676 RepID=A0A3B0RNY1_9ZZZZ